MDLESFIESKEYELQVLRSCFSEQYWEHIMLEFAEVYHQSKVNNVVLDAVSNCPFCDSDNLHQYKLHHISCRGCKEHFEKGCD